jgi:hypothetical protein
MLSPLLLPPHTVYATWSFDLEELGLGLPPPPPRGGAQPAAATAAGITDNPTTASSDQGPLQPPTTSSYTSGSTAAAVEDSCGSCWSDGEQRGSSRHSQGFHTHSLEPAGDSSTAAGDFSRRGHSSQRQLFCSPVFEVEAGVAPALAAYQLVAPNTSSISTKW